MPSSKSILDKHKLTAVIQIVSSVSSSSSHPSSLLPLQTYASVGVPCWLVLVFGVFGFMPSSYILLETKWPQGKMLSGQGQEPPRPGTTHTQDTEALSSGRRKRIGVFMKRISKQQENRGTPRAEATSPVKNRHRAPFHSAGDCPVAFRIKFLCHLKVDHYLNPR